MDMAEFKRRKAELIAKWGEKLLTPTEAELRQQEEDVADLCRFAKVRPAKLLNGMAQAYLRGER
jgi:hypothetical protein